MYWVIPVNVEFNILIWILLIPLILGHKILICQSKSVKDFLWYKYFIEHYLKWSDSLYEGVKHFSEIKRWLMWRGFALLCLKMFLRLLHTVPNFTDTHRWQLLTNYYCYKSCPRCNIPSQRHFNVTVLIFCKNALKVILTILS